jgi:hypothetical protein
MLLCTDLFLAHGVVLHHGTISVATGAQETRADQGSDENLT